MKCRHLDFEFELPDDWIQRAEMVGFRPAARFYRYRDAPDCGPTVLIAVSDIAPIPRTLPTTGTPFRDAESVLAILSGFREEAELPPVGIWPVLGADSRVKLYDGLHRFYCSVAMGFTHIPAQLDPRANPGPEGWPPGSMWVNQLRTDV